MRTPKKILENYTFVLSAFSAISIIEPRMEEIIDLLKNYDGPGENIENAIKDLAHAGIKLQEAMGSCESVLNMYESML